jgi:mono/diheme cytochrome c family protein
MWHSGTTVQLDQRATHCAALKRNLCRSRLRNTSAGRRTRGTDFNAANVAKCPNPAAPAGTIVAASAQPPEGTHPSAGAATFSAPAGATREMVVIGERIYHGQVGGAACTGCHGETGQGTPLGPALTGNKWLWSNGGYAGIKKTIAEGVSQPKKYRSPMPPMGGAQLTPGQLSAVAAYVWNLSHHASNSRP